MDTTGKTGQIDNETLGLVLEEFTQEQRTTNQSMQDLITAINIIGSKVEDIKKDLAKPATVPTANDSKEVQQMIDNGISDVKLLIGTQTKSNRKFQILLFPEQDAKLFYKIVFSRWLLYLLVMLFLKYLYQWGIHYSDNQQAVKIEQLKNDRVKKSWNYMYNNNNKEVKRLMEKAYISSQEIKNQ